MSWLVKVLLSSLAVVVAAYLIPGVEVDSFMIAIIVAIVISIMNSFFRPLFVILTLPVTILTFGLFLLAVNAFMIMISSSIVDGFHVSGFWSALFFSFVLTFLQSMFNQTEEGTKG
ncbi:MAG: phage holin family protein [Flavobacteriales bacterium]|nr:phage holin family protein [Flavobacteriales bacterium]